MHVLKPKKSHNIEVLHPLLNRKAIRLFIKREDMLHPHISGNKYRKLFYNLLEAKRLGHNKILTFGGVFSNHIAATAAAGSEFGFETIGVIRGDEWKGRLDELGKENPTIRFARAQGMKLYFIDRKTYREEKDKPAFIARLQQKFGEFYLVPQGGTNELAVKGTEKILSEEDVNFDYVTCAVGTGGTIAGIINSSFSHQEILGFPALKENFLHDEINHYAHKNNWTLIRDYHMGGFAKINPELIRFINDFYHRTGIPLDAVYTGKMLFGLFDMIKKGYFPKGTQILAIHTGGLQGNDGINIRLKKKGEDMLEIPSFYSSGIVPG